MDIWELNFNGKEGLDRGVLKVEADDTGVKVRYGWAGEALG